MGAKQNINKELNLRNPKKSIIIGSIKIEVGERNERIINSLENVKKDEPHLKTENFESKENEKEIEHFKI